MKDNFKDEVVRIFNDSAAMPGNEPAFLEALDNYKNALIAESRIGDAESAKKALLRYMEWWSESMYCAGWLNNLHEEIFDRDEVAKWLREKAGGYWKWNDEWKPGDGWENQTIFIEDE